MNAISIILLTLVAVLIVLALRYHRRTRGRRSCCSDRGCGLCSVNGSCKHTTSRICGEN